MVRERERGEEKIPRGWEREPGKMGDCLDEEQWACGCSRLEDMRGRD